MKKFDEGGNIIFLEEVIKKFEVGEDKEKSYSKDVALNNCLLSGTDSNELSTVGGKETLLLRLLTLKLRNFTLLLCKLPLFSDRVLGYSYETGLLELSQPRICLNLLYEFLMLIRCWIQQNSDHFLHLSCFFYFMVVKI